MSGENGGGGGGGGGGGSGGSSNRHAQPGNMPRPAFLYLVYLLKVLPLLRVGHLTSVSSLWKLDHRHALCYLDDSRSQQVDNQDKPWLILRDLDLYVCMEILSIKSYVFSSHAEEHVAAKPPFLSLMRQVYSLGHLPCSFVPWLSSNPFSHKP